MQNISNENNRHGRTLIMPSSPSTASMANYGRDEKLTVHLYAAWFSLFSPEKITIIDLFGRPTHTISQKEKRKAFITA